MERPILVSTDLIKPVQKGLKTETRRLSGLDVVNEEPDKWELIDALPMDGKFTAVFDYKPKGIVQEYAVCPYGMAGDILWVRENWFTQKLFNNVKPALLPANAHAGYMADDVRPGWAGKNRPSIHMPKRFTRIRLELIDVSIERLQAIKRHGVLAEGAGHEVRQFWLYGLDSEGRDNVYRQSFARLWQKINGTESWNINPWVWVLKFKRLA